MSDNEKLHHCECNLPYFMRFGVFFTAGTPRLGIPASQWHGEVLPPLSLWSQNREHAVQM